MRLDLTVFGISAFRQAIRSHASLRTPLNPTKEVQTKTHLTVVDPTKQQLRTAPYLPTDTILLHHTIHQPALSISH